jgi:hypothetical protein
MPNTCKLILTSDSNISPNIDIIINGQIVKSEITASPDEHNNFIVSFTRPLEIENNIIILNNADQIKLVDIIIDDIRFGLVTFLCTTVNGTQNTQLDGPGEIDIKITAPVWQFWCDKMNAFNYEDYPLGSVG